MYKLILAILLTVISTSAMAEWQLVTSADGIKKYVDFKSIKKNGSKVTMWTMTDYEASRLFSNKPYLSSKDKFSFDCKNESQAIVSTAIYEGNMGIGQVVQTLEWSDSEKQYTAIPPDTMGEKLLKVACKLN